MKFPTLYKTHPEIIPKLNFEDPVSPTEPDLIPEKIHSKLRLHTNCLYPGEGPSCENHEPIKILYS
jgi:hypothetical protein